MPSNKLADMNIHYSDNRKIDPNQGMRLGDGTVNDGDRVEIGPTALAYAEWQDAGLALPDLNAVSYTHLTLPTNREV